MRIIKLAIDDVAEPLPEIINLILESGCFPDTLKMVTVLPMFKSGDPERLENNRPISNLHERLANNHIYKYQTDFNLLYNSLFGFCRNHSTSIVLIQLVDN